MKIKIFFWLIVITIISYQVRADNQVIKFDKHHIYEYKFDARKTSLEVIKALDDGKLGLENVLNAAKRHNALAAINGGFFYKGDKYNGIPVGILITPTMKFITPGNYDSFYVSPNGNIKFTNIDAKISLLLDEKNVIINSLNKPLEQGISIFTNNYWTSTLTAPGTYEIVVEDNKVSEISHKGNSKIPQNGFVIIANDVGSYDQLKSIKLLSNVEYKIELLANNQILDHSQIKYLLNGSNIMIHGKQINKKLLITEKDSSFRDEPHGRTAICQYDRNNYSLVVVDHNPAMKVYDLSIREMMIPLKDQGFDRETILKMSNAELLEKFNKIEAHKDHVSIGIGLIKFADWLRQRGCTNAINLDGGGSATLVINGEVTNNPTGLTNITHNGKNLREVGDIIMVKRHY